MTNWTRRPPLLPPERGRCRWCGKAIKPRLKRDGTPHRVQFSFHRRCRVEFNACLSPAKGFYAEVAKREGERCWDCSEEIDECLRGEPEIVESRDRAGRRIILVKAALGLELDHEIPLWKVALLPQAQRRRYFLPENLRLRCRACHACKTTAKTAERMITEASSVKYKDPQEVIERLVGMGATVTISWLRGQGYVDGSLKPRITKAGRKFLAETEAASRGRIPLAGERWKAA